MMTTELMVLGWVLVLAVVQIFLHAGARNKETGLKYNAGPRDGGAPPEGVVTGRLHRAKENLYETLPLFAAAVLIAHVTGREGATTLYAAWAYLLARIVYVPLYAMGVPMIRSLVWGVSMLALVVYFTVILHP